MLGLPNETDDEADEIVAFVQRARDIMQAHGRQRGRLGELSVNIGIFVPKRGTPLALEPLSPIPDCASSGAAPGEYSWRNTKRVDGSLERGHGRGTTIFERWAGLNRPSLLLEVLKGDGNWRGAVRKRIRKG